MQFLPLSYILKKKNVYNVSGVFLRVLTSNAIPWFELPSG